MTVQRPARAISSSSSAYSSVMGLQAAAGSGGPSGAGSSARAATAPRPEAGVGSSSGCVSVEPECCVGGRPFRR